MKKISLIFAALIFSFSAFAASLLPNGKQQFFNTNGVPLSGGRVYFYVPGTSTPKDTWKNPEGTVFNTNPVMLDAGGFAVIYGSGVYRQVVKDSNGNTLFDQLTSDTSATASSWAGTAGGSGNSIIISATSFSARDGQEISWKILATNTGSANVIVNENTFLIVKDTPQGVVPLTGGEMQAGGIATVKYDATLGSMHLAVPQDVSPFVTTASAATVDLGALASHNVAITGAATITSFGSSASTTFPLYRLVFSGAATITYNATTLLTPNNKNIAMIAGGSADARYLGSGNWQIINYTLPLRARTRTTLSVAGPGTYVVPAGVTRLFIRMCGAGAGGGGVGAGAISGANGGNTTFNSVVTIGGDGGTPTSSAFGGRAGIGGAGGTGACLTRVRGDYGLPGAANASGASALAGRGGNGPLWGAGIPDPLNSLGYMNARNICSGGAGATGTADGQGSAGGGGSGEYCELEIVQPATSYSYTVGAKGNGGTGPTPGGDGYAGGIIIDEFRE